MESMAKKKLMCNGKTIKSRPAALSGTLFVKARKPYWSQRIVIKKDKPIIPVHDCPKGRCRKDCLFEFARRTFGWKI